MTRHAFAAWKRDSAQILTLAWPIWIGQMAIIAYGVLDTLMTARYAALDLAALSLGTSLYISVFVGLSGILQALAPIIGQLYGAQQYPAIGTQWRQGLWLALALALPGIALLWEPNWLLNLTQASPALIDKARQYLQMEALGLPAVLLARLYATLNTAISLPRRVMAMQLLGLLIKLPLNDLLIFGAPWLGLPAMGGPGSALATALVSWLLVGLMAWQLAYDSRPHRVYHALALGKQWSWPQWSAQVSLLKLGMPIGLSYLIEVTAFTCMALFIARFGASTLAGHQIAANFAGVMYMLPMSLAIALSTCVAQCLGAMQLDAPTLLTSSATSESTASPARRMALHGIALAIIMTGLLGVVIGFIRPWLVAAYTPDAAIKAQALPLLGFIAVYQVFDAVQVNAAFVLRAYKVTVLPTCIYALSLWGVGLGGGYMLGFNVLGWVPPLWQGAAGFWLANSVSLVLASALLLFYFVRIARRARAS